MEAYNASQENWFKSNIYTTHICIWKVILYAIVWCLIGLYLLSWVRACSSCASSSLSSSLTMTNHSIGLIRNNTHSLSASATACLRAYVCLTYAYEVECTRVCFARWYDFVVDWSIYPKINIVKYIYFNSRNVFIYMFASQHMRSMTITSI